MLRKKNTGKCNKSGETSGELIEHFLIGLDKTCLMADANGDMKIIGKFGRRKHEKMAGDCRASATMCRTVTNGGSNAPTVFLMEGKNRRSSFTDHYLVEQLCCWLYNADDGEGVNDRRGMAEYEAQAH